MNKLKMQIGESASCDFEESTWSFEMPEGFNITAGKFAILPFEKMTAIIETIRALNTSINQHAQGKMIVGSDLTYMSNRCNDFLKEII